jgi:ppGpp synthetase/RelA/SpoT-type nucleotidyltranferase
VKITGGIRALYDELLPDYDELKKYVDGYFATNISERWHYESRIKSEESFALKLETGRVRNPRTLEDFFACTLVVENLDSISAAIAQVENNFKIVVRRPDAGPITKSHPGMFEFDDLRLHVVRDPSDQRPPIRNVDGILFEIQVKTFLQHAWSIATHDLVYKSDSVSWARTRIAAQVRAMLENAELSIDEAMKLAASPRFTKSSDRFNVRNEIIIGLREKWTSDLLPQNISVLAGNLADLLQFTNYSVNELWTVLDLDTEAGYGTKQLNLSPYGVVIAAFLRQRKVDFFARVKNGDGKYVVFIPNEVAFDVIPESVKDRVIRV